MAAEEILGISGKMDISDIQASLDKLCDGLNKVGVDTDALSQKMTKALNNIAQSDGDIASKTQQAMQVLKTAMDEASTGIQKVPEMIDNANKRVETIQGTIGKLNEQLSQTDKNSNAFNAIAKQIDIQKQSLQVNQEDARTLSTAYDDVRNAISQVSGAYQALNAVSVASSATNAMDAAASEANTVAKTANTVASAANAAGTLAEGVAHVDNASKLGQETDAVEQNTKARQQQQETISAEAQTLERLANNLQQGNINEEQYQRIVEQETAALEEQKKALNELSQQREYHNSHPLGSGYELDNEGNVTNSADIDKWQAETTSLNQQYEAQKKIVEESEAALNRFIEAHNNLAKSQENAASTTQQTQNANSQEVKSYEQLSTEIDVLEKKLSQLQQRKQETLSVGNGFSIPVVPADALANSGMTFGSDRLESLRSVNQEIEATKQKLTEAKEKLQEFQQAGEGSGTVSFANYAEDIKNISFAIDETKKQLADYEAQYDKLANKDNLSAKQKQELEELSQKIDDTKKKLQELSEQLREKNEETFIGKLRDKLSDAGQKTSEFGDKVKNGILSPINSLKEKISDSSFGQRFSAEFTQAKAGLNDFKDGIVNVITANGKFQAQIGVIGEAFKGLGIPISGSLTAIKSVTKALWAMCATPLGATIAAVALAFKAVHTWMTKSAEGQQVYTKLMAYFGSLASSVTDIVITLGSYIYHCFADNNGTMRDFGNNFIKTFKTAVTAAVSLVSGLGTTIKGVLNMDWDAFTEGLKKTWDGLKGAGETVISAFKTSLSAGTGTIKTLYKGFTDEKLGKELGNELNGALPKAAQAASLAGQIQQTQIDIKKNTEEQLKLDEKIAEQKNKIYTLQGKEKIAAIETTKELIKQKYDKQIKQQQQLAELSDKNAKLHTQSLASIAAERELRKDVLKTQIQMNAEQRMLIRQQSSAERKEASQGKQAAKKEAKQDAQVTSAEGKLDEVEYKNDYARLQSMQDLEQKITDAKIEAREEGEEKVLAQRNRQLEKELEQIEKEKEAAVKAERDRQKAEFDARQDVIKAKGGKIRNWDDKTDLDVSKVKEIISKYDEYANIKVQISNQNEQKRLKEQKENERASVQSYLKEYGTSKEKRTALQDEAEDKKKKLDENRTITDTDRDYQKKSIDASLKKSLKDLDFQDLKKSINWDFVFGDLEHVSESTLGAVKQQLQDFIDSAKDLQPDQIKTVVDAMSQIQDKIDLTNPIKSIKEAKSEYSALSKEYAKYKKQYEDASANGDIEAQKTAAEKMIKTEQKMVKAQSKEKASYDEVMNVAQQYAQALNDLGDTIGGTTGECIKLAASAISAGLGMADGIKKFGDAVSTMEKSVAILAIIEAALKAIQLITQVFGDTADATLTDYVETLDTYIDLLNDSISDLNDSMSDTQNTMKDTIAYYKDLVELEKESATSIKSQSQTWLNSGAKKGIFGIGSSSSEGVKISKQIEKDLKSSNKEVKQFYTEGYNALNEYYKKVKGKYASSASDFGRMDFIWELSDDDLLKLAEDTKALSLLGDTLSSAITDYASKIKQIGDDEDSFAESLLNVSFDDFYDDFVSLIKDMDNTSEDFANNFAEYMRNALVKNLVAEQYKGKLEALYQKAADWGKQGVLEDHIDELKKEYEEYAEAAKKDVETIDKITGYEDSTSQSATTAAIESITEDQASSLIGIGYAMQIALEQGNEMRAQMSVDISSMRAFSEQTANNLSEMRDIQYQGLEQLEAINKNTAPIIYIREDIASMYKLMKDKY